MRKFIITYDLINAKDYKHLYNYLTSFSYYWHINCSTWIITTDATADQIKNTIIRIVGDDCRLFITEFVGSMAYNNMLDECQKAL